MRTKTLLIAAAALAATVISSEAQAVYSANVVGYVNVVLPGNASYSLIANPFDDGNGNHLTNLLATLPNGSSVLTWNGTTYNGAISFTAGSWGGDAQLPPGIGFFVKNGKAGSPALTNTFVGTVVAPNNSSVTNSLILGFNLVGSIIPYAGDLTTDTNLNIYGALPNGSGLITWPNGGSTFNGQVSFTAGSWGGTEPVGVGQGFFVSTKHNGTNWVQSLNLQ